MVEALCAKFNMERRQGVSGGDVPNNTPFFQKVWVALYKILTWHGKAQLFDSEGLAEGARDL